MSDEDKKTSVVKSTETSSKFKVTSEVELPSTGEKVVLKKLKAGKYYEAQKLYVAWISDLQKIFESSKEDLKGLIDKEGVVDEKKLEARLKEKDNTKVSDTLTSADTAGEKRLALLAVCLDMNTEELNESYYPEDIDTLLGEAIKLNNFLENVKKSVALGA